MFVMELVRIFKQNQILRNTTYILIGSILLIISEKIKIPFYPVPMTMQTFVVLFLGILLGPLLGTATVILYLFEGLLGLPVFSNSPEKGVGLTYFTGPTMGYLIGFIFASYFAGFINNQYIYFKILIKFIFWVSIIYFLGLIWLGNLIGWDKPIFEYGAKPFLLAELFKILLLLLISKGLLKIKSII